MHMSKHAKIIRVIQGMVKAGAGIFFLLVVCMFVSPARNVVLWPFWPNAWRKMALLEILEIECSPLPSNVTALEECPYSKIKPLKREEVDQGSILDFRDVRDLVDDIGVRDIDHASFLPALEFNEKVDLVWLLSVMTRALNNNGIGFFMRGGSLLGAARHKGIIPWDDDIDVALNVTDWRKVRDVLSCIEGYYLAIQPNMHWKFTKVGKGYPFIDLFFFSENEKYIWALTDYTRRTFALRKEDVLPLQPTEFEGVKVLLPKRSLDIAKELYSFDTCESRSSDHKSGATFKRIIRLPCEELGYLYNLYGLE